MHAMAILDSDLLTSTELAQQLRVSRPWVCEAAKEVRIPCVRLGGPDGPVRFVRGDIDAWLELARQNWLPGESTTRTVAVVLLGRGERAVAELALDEDQRVTGR